MSFQLKGETLFSVFGKYKQREVCLTGRVGPILQCVPTQFLHSKLEMDTDCIRTGFSENKPGTEILMGKVP